jgi:2-oxoacid:acceptor oxidoreductase gamma subunit (pyruvate/2-ketoisovalerate family)
VIEIVVHGRGGRGGVTLAKLIAGMYFLRGSYVQAFGVYGAERSGAPVKAYVRVDAQEITAHVPITEPGHIVVIDPSLITPQVAAGLKSGGWLVLNTPLQPAAFADTFPGCRVATVDANAIAGANRLGSAALPIVNTTMLGATAALLDLHIADIEGALKEAGLKGGNLAAARTAFHSVRTEAMPGQVVAIALQPPQRPLGFLDQDVGGLPTTHTGEWASRRPHSRELAAVCSEVCPAGNDVRGFLQAAARGDYDAALSLILETSPFPGTCGRVCPAPCMAGCNRAQLDEAVNVREVERAVAGRGRLPEPRKSWRSERVAVVGSGPAGLSAAYHLARMGYGVTVFEAGPESGGLLRHGIPAYRLPRDVLEREIGFVLRHSVDIETHHPVDRAELARLRRQFAAVFVATGLQGTPSLELGGACNGAVLQGLDFLERACRGEASVAGDSLVIVGGGNTAMDAARTALRLGARDVRVVYRRTRAEMPAIAEEVDEALEEGIELDELEAPLRLYEAATGPTLVCRRMRLGEPDESGRRRPVPLEGDGALVELPCDRLLLALGQSPDVSVLPKGAEIRGCRIAGEEEDAPLFVGGDLATGEGTVAAAVGSGRLAAVRIHGLLDGSETEEPQPHELAGPDVIALDRFPKTAQHKSAMLAVDERRRTFLEVRRGLVDEEGEDATAAEAARCLSCGACNECETCVAYCPEGVVCPAGGHRYLFDYEYCKGCGLCAAQCPRGVIVMEDCAEEVCT